MVVNIPHLNNVQLGVVDNHTVLSSYTVNTDSSYLRRMVIVMQPSVKSDIQITGIKYTLQKNRSQK